MEAWRAFLARASDWRRCPDRDGFDAARLARGASPRPISFLNVIPFFQLAATSRAFRCCCFSRAAPEAARRRADYFAGLLVFGLAPILGSRATQALAESHAGTELLLGTVSSDGLHAAFIVFALPAGWMPGSACRQSARIRSKDFSDAQLLARAWWLMFIASIRAGIPENKKRRPVGCDRVRGRVSSIRRA